MAVNKVVYNTENGAETLIDLTGDSVTPETLAEGAIAHDASGNVITGVGKTTSVLYTAQTLTDAQKKQARENIGADYANATTSKSGLMSAGDKGTFDAMKNKLDGIEKGANRTIVDTDLDAESTNPVQNKVVSGAFDAMTVAIDEMGDMFSEIIVGMYGEDIPTDESQAAPSIRDIAEAVVINSADEFMTKEEFLTNDGTKVKSADTATHSAYAYKLSELTAPPTPFNVGSATEPVYFADGVPVKATHKLEKSVPADAKFTDTVYTLPVATSSALGGVMSGGNITVSSTGAVTVNSATKATNDKNGNDISRIYCSMIPAGTAISANSDLNTTAFLKVGNYYCSKNADVATLTNCPTTMAFMMQVYSPLSTTIDNESKTWVYRLRKLITHKGEEYYQFVNSGATGGVFTYGSWVKNITASDTATTSKAGLMSAADKVKVNGMEASISTALTNAKAYTDEKIADIATDVSLADSMDWLNANGDTSKRYVVPPSRNIYEFSESVEPLYKNAIETAQSHDSTAVYNGTGYKDGYYLSVSNASGGENVGADSAFTATGFIPYNDTNGTFPPIYVKGLSWVKTSHSRLYFFKEDKAVEWGASSALSISGSNTNLETYFTVTQLGDAYWSLTPKSAFNSLMGNSDLPITSTIAYFRMSLQGKGANLIISVGKEIKEGGLVWNDTGEKYVSIDSAINDRLWGKKVVFTGDSICDGATDETGVRGYAQRIGVKHSMNWTNAGISGATFTKNLTGSAGCIGDVDFGTDPDYIILEGGCNDADLIGGKDASGNMPTKYGSYDYYHYIYNHDTDTFCGAVEALFQRLTTDYAGAKIGFIITHKIGGYISNSGYYYDENHKTRFYYLTIIELCKKWGIPYLDLWEKSYLNPMNPTHLSGDKAFYSNSDYYHLTARGYDHITPIIEKWMETL